MYSFLLGMVLSTGAQAPGQYFGYPGFGCCGGPAFAMPPAYPVAVVAGQSTLEKQVQNLRKRVKTLEEKLSQAEPQIKMTRDALLELAKRVEKIDDEVDDLDDDVEDIQDELKSKGPMIKSKLDELAERLTKVERQQRKEKEAKKQAEIDALKEGLEKLEQQQKKAEEAKKKAEFDAVKERLEKLEQGRPQAPGAAPGAPPVPPPPPAPRATSSLDNLIERLRQIEVKVQMGDDGKQQAILDRLGKLEGGVATTDQKLQSTIDAVRGLAESVDKGFLDLNSRVRALEQGKKDPTVPAAGALPAPPPPQGAEQISRNGDTALLIVNLPEDARIFLNGQATKSTGARRSYVTPKLQPGKEYTYEVRAEMTVNGRQVSETRQVTFAVGRQVRVSFAGLGQSALDRLRLVSFE
jgi:uncharacterized protein (TIGR03000 family)